MRQNDINTYTASHELIVWKHSAIVLAFIAIGSMVVVILYAASVIVTTKSDTTLPPGVTTLPPGVTTTLPPGHGACTGSNGATAPRISGYWLNKDNPGISNGLLFNKAADVDVVFIASFSPDPRTLNCTSLPRNVFSLAPGNSLTQLPIVGVVKNNVKSGTKIVLSLGGSSFGLLEWCHLVWPFVQNYACDQFGGGGFDNSSCGSVYAYETDHATTSCYKSGNPSSQPSFRHYKPRSYCPNETCTCCCSNDYTLTNGTCVLTPTVQIPIRDDCSYGLYRNTTDGIVKYMYDILVNNGADGYDFDYETPDDGGHVAAALVAFGIALKTYSESMHRPLYTSMTLMSGTSFSISYGPLFECFRSNWCPFTWAVPMPYANCMYPYTGVNVYPESFNHQSQSYEVTSVPTNTGFTWNGLVDGWTQTHFTDDSVTRLVLAVDAAVHELSWFPCSISPADIQHVYDDYTASHLPNACTHITGLFFWYYNQFDTPTTAQFDYNTTWLTQLITQWNSLITG